MSGGSVAMASTGVYRPHGGGAVGELVRAFDWAATALGASDG